ncbi:hypothetical protein F0919_01780 [Taibaiella lutea]|uniref:Lipocalin-like domain-containing protein n=1 Tax=Taibaiella lutea TaxID=2608001 RepID=A0A5M6CR45_9BACT|nr:hypothetical protein [Taibaiella lutea]KAA5536422.1 hypothetical protein F0919_01780 [Taibaiella lutea]
MKKLFYCSVVLLLVSVTLFAQKKSVSKRNLPPFLAGTWIWKEVDSTFGHETVIELLFTNEYNWKLGRSIDDGAVEYEDMGSFKVVNDSLLIISSVKEGRKEHPKPLKLLFLNKDTLKLPIGYEQNGTLYTRKY